jgi:hypothetical protein
MADQPKSGSARPPGSRPFVRALLRSLRSTVVIFVVTEIAYCIFHGGFNSRNLSEVVLFYYGAGILVFAGLFVWEYWGSRARPK